MGLEMEDQVGRKRGGRKGCLKYAAMGKLLFLIGKDGLVRPFGSGEY